MRLMRRLRRHWEKFSTGKFTESALGNAGIERGYAEVVKGRRVEVVFSIY